MCTDLKFWILTILNMNSKLEYYFDSLEKRVGNLADCLTRDTVSLYNEIMDLNDKKVLLINMKVLYDSFVSALKTDERLIVEQYAKNSTLDCIAKILGVNRSTVMRRLNKAVNRCAVVLTALGFSAKRFKDEYCGYIPVYSVFNKIKSEYAVRRSASEGVGAVKLPEIVKMSDAVELSDAMKFAIHRCGSDGEHAFERGV